MTSLAVAAFLYTSIALWYLSVYIYHMRMEWDGAKREATLRERGLDFAIVADADWDAALTAEDTRQEYAEPRYVNHVPIHDRLCVVAWCVRGMVRSW